MKTIVLAGSRNNQGQTAQAVEALLHGMSGGGHQADVVFLPEKKIQRCRQCDENGWGLCRAEGRCVIEDDFAQIVDGLRAADAAVFATPVYFGDMSESLSAFLDRLRRLTVQASGKKGIAGKPAVGICVAGGGGGGAPNCVFLMERVLGTCGFDIMDMIPARRQNLPMKLDVLRTVGKWFARQVAEKAQA